MIIQTTRISRKGGVRYLAHHLLDKTSDNERIEVLSGDRHALDDAQALATVKGCTYSVRHLSISPEFEMSPAQLTVFVRSIDDEFGIGPDRPRLVVRHIKDGRSHFHLAVAEVDPSSLTVLDCRNDFTRFEKLARTYEREYGETIQPARAERHARKTEGFSDVARKKAERIAPDFDRTEIKRAFSIGPAGFIAEVLRQGLYIAEGDKGPILVNGSGTFVAAANRTAGVSRGKFSKFMEEIKNDGNNFRIPTVADVNGEEHQIALAPPLSVGAATGTRPNRPAYRLAGAHPQCATAAGRSVEEHGRAARQATSPIARRFSHEHWFPYHLGKVDLDGLLIRARELAVWVQLIFEPQTVRLTRQIQELKSQKEKFVPANASKGSLPTYDYGRRMTP
ncbi:hypothetical protein [uncultured Hoeflea sp.]|uniref:relaxase/mobilization nuclease domain-containing protein n=1 Tax=uncultured Hoeflea sp. TaxID=538666 RepID=UPI0030EEDCCB|tara:strand:- start:23884 stop:25062 length:1179 start_codon:yes stop_codon:yes gene_type:complete